MCLFLHMAGPIGAAYSANTKSVHHRLCLWADKTSLQEAESSDNPVSHVHSNAHTRLGPFLWQLGNVGAQVVEHSQGLFNKQESCQMCCRS
jgi:hypothetical protein